MWKWLFGKRSKDQNGDEKKKLIALMNLKGWTYYPRNHPDLLLFSKGFLIADFMFYMDGEVSISYCGGKFYRGLPEVMLEYVQKHL